MVKREWRGVFGALFGATVLAAGLASEPAFSAPACGERQFNVYFETGSAELNAESRKELAAAQRSLHRCDIQKVRVVGLTGAKAPPGETERLSERRAQTVADTLAAGGWARDRMELVAVGDKGAKVGDVEKPLRRRVHVIVQSQPAVR